MWPWKTNQKGYPKWDVAQTKERGGESESRSRGQQGSPSQRRISNGKFYTPPSDSDAQISVSTPREGSLTSQASSPATARDVTVCWVSRRCAIRPQPAMLPVPWIVKQTNPVPLQTFTRTCARKEHNRFQMSAYRSEHQDSKRSAASGLHKEQRTLQTDTHYQGCMRSGDATGLGSMPVARSTSLAGDNLRTAASIVAAHVDVSRGSKRQKVLVPCHSGGSCR